MPNPSGTLWPVALDAAPAPVSSTSPSGSHRTAIASPDFAPNPTRPSIQPCRPRPSPCLQVVAEKAAAGAAGRPPPLPSPPPQDPSAPRTPHAASEWEAQLLPAAVAVEVRAAGPQGRAAAPPPPLRCAQRGGASRPACRSAGLPGPAGVPPVGKHGTALRQCCSRCPASLPPSSVPGLPCLLAQSSPPLASVASHSTPTQPHPLSPGRLP